LLVDAAQIIMREKINFIFFTRRFKTPIQAGSLVIGPPQFYEAGATPPISFFAVGFRARFDAAYRF